MTNKEAIERLQFMKITYAPDDKKALDMAIAALKQQPEPERWRDAEWPGDAANPPKEARFSDDGKRWGELPLTGFALGDWYSHSTRWNYCQVRDE